MSFLDRLIRSALCRKLIAWGFVHMNSVLPVHRLRETRTLSAFHHPKPGYPTRILIVPKKKIAGLLEMRPADDGLLVEAFSVARELVRELHLEEQGYRLIVNGGKHQEIPQLHFHLISGG
jgi:histidine triad (HIT) family protein